MMNVMLKPAMEPYNVSAIAAPAPETIADQRSRRHQNIHRTDRYGDGETCSQSFQKQPERIQTGSPWELAGIGDLFQDAGYLKHRAILRLLRGLAKSPIGGRLQKFLDCPRDIAKIRKYDSDSLLAHPLGVIAFLRERPCVE